MSMSKRQLRSQNAKFSHGEKTGESGYSIIEVLIAGLIISIASLGLGNAIMHLAESRKKTQLVSQSVGMEASIVSALQDPATYVGNPAVLTEVANGAPVTAQPTVAVTLDPAKASQTTFNLVAGGAPAYIDKDNKPVASAAGQWTVSAQISALNKVGTHYAYAYKIQVNPALANIATTGAANVSAPSAADLSIVIPKEAISTAQGAAATVACTPATDYLAMMGLTENNTKICIERARDKCSTKAIAKGFKLVSRGPNLYSYELDCQNLRSLTCPSQLKDGGVVDPNLYNPYTLQSFVPNTLDSSGGTPGTGTCVFVAASSASYPAAGSLSGDNGISVTGACPPHYVVSTISCLHASDNANPGPHSCASSADAIPQKPAAGAVSSGIGTNNVKCQLTETQSCCGDNHADCAPIWTGKVSLSYTCKLNSTTPETLGATSN